MSEDEKDSHEQLANWKTPEDERSVVGSGFEEWSKLNAAQQDLQSIDNLPTLVRIERYGAVFREGSKRLMTELRDPKDNKIKLIDKLNIQGLKAELEALRQRGDRTTLGKREAEIANLIQKAISEYPYEGSTYHVTEILNKKEMNCVGASVLGGALLDEIGIRYLVGNIGSHVLLIVKTSDGRVWWQDMQDGKEIDILSNEELTADKVVGKKEDDTTITPEDIATFADNPQNEGMTFSVKKTHWTDKPMTVLPPEIGLELNVLINTGFMLGNEGKNRAAIEVLHIALQKAPSNADVYLGLARANKNLGLYNQAIDACQKALVIEPEDSYLKSVMEELKGLQTSS